MKKSVLNNFNKQKEADLSSREFPYGNETASSGTDYTKPDPGLEWNEATGTQKESEGKKKKLRFMYLGQTAAAILAVVLTTNAFGRDFLREDPFADSRISLTTQAYTAWDASSIPAVPPLSTTPIPPATTSTATEAPTTEAPTTEAPTTEAPTTEALTTEAPTTEAPTTEAPTTEAPTTAAVYDDAFPLLVNPWPNGYSSDNWTNTFDYQNDYLEHKVEENYNHYLEPGAEYLLMGSEAAGVLPLHVGVNRTEEFDDIVDLSDLGAHYDSDTNTLTLTDFHPEGGDYNLEANLMGNNFTLEIHGENRLNRITIWGWYFGGSLTITGDGSLTVNGSQKSGVGIYMKSEMSESCIMIDREVTLEVFGSPEVENSAAIYIYATTEPVGLYYLKPQQMEGGVLTTLQEADLSVGKVYVFGIMQEEDPEAYSLHVKFSPAP